MYSLRYWRKFLDIFLFNKLINVLDSKKKSALDIILQEKEV